MKLANYIFTVFGFLSLSLPAAYGSSAGQEKFDLSFKAWDQILKSSVKVTGKQSRVNYRALKSSPQALDDFLASVESVKKETFERWNSEQRLSFLINAYNAFTIKLIVDHYPVKSIKDTGSFLSSPWKKKFFKLWGEEHALDDIEHKMIRPVFKEPKVHFALVCASKGCPPLSPTAFLPEKLAAQLEEGASIFLTDLEKNRFDSVKSTLFISSIFKWYGDDFKEKYGSAQTFIAPRITRNSEDQKKASAATTQINYLDYDWTLNEE